MPKANQAGNVTNGTAIQRVPKGTVLLEGARIIIWDGAIGIASADSTVPDVIISRASGGGLSVTAMTSAGDLTVNGIFTAAGYAGFGGNIGLGSAVSQIGFYNATPVSKPEVTGSKGANAALTSLMTALADLGLVTDSTS